jgi:hypothetical protein
MAKSNGVARNAAIGKSKITQRLRSMAHGALAARRAGVSRVGMLALARASGA